jgi:hypothetical protein
MFFPEDVPPVGISNIRLSMASISELLAYAMDMDMSCCSVCRVRVLDLSSLSSAGPCAVVDRSFQSVRLASRGM